MNSMSWPAAGFTVFVLKIAFVGACNRIAKRSDTDAPLSAEIEATTYVNETCRICVVDPGAPVGELCARRVWTPAKYGLRKSSGQLDLDDLMPAA